MRPVRPAARASGRPRLRWPGLGPGVRSGRL